MHKANKWVGALVAVRGAEPLDRHLLGGIATDGRTHQAKGRIGFCPPASGSAHGHTETVPFLPQSFDSYPLNPERPSCG